MQTLSPIDIRLALNAIYSTIDPVTGNSSLTDENNQQFVTDLIKKLEANKEYLSKNL